MKRKMLIAIIISALTVAAVLLCALVVITNRVVVWKASRSDMTDCKTEYSASKTYDCIVVLGAKVKDGTPSAMLEDRLKGAIELYKKAGFSEAGRRKGFYTKPTEDALVMVCKIK